jgi:hypothetical protein
VFLENNETKVYFGDQGRLMSHNFAYKCRLISHNVAHMHPIFGYIFMSSSHEIWLVRRLGIGIGLGFVIAWHENITQFPFQALLWRASLQGLLSLAARQISPVEKSTGDVIVYIEGRSGYIIGHYRRNLKIILYSQAFCWTNVYYWVLSKSTHEWPRMTTSDHEWPRMTTSDHEWPRMTTSDHVWFMCLKVIK